MILFLYRKNIFEAYTVQHYLALFVLCVSGFLILYHACKQDRPRQQRLLFYYSLIPFLGTFLMYPFLVFERPINLQEDLPLHMCRALALLAPLVALKNNRYWMGVFYFWIIAGTFQANITPDIEYGFPHWNYFTYWMTHGFLVVVALYYVVVLKIAIGWKDLRNAFIMMNVFVLITLITNYMLDSNYMYTIAKPPVASMLDILGPWPFYLITGQLLALALFFIALLPFKFSELIASRL